MKIKVLADSRQCNPENGNLSFMEKEQDDAIDSFGTPRSGEGDTGEETG